MFIAMKWYLYLLTSYDQVVIVKIVRQVTFKNWIIQCINHGLKVYITYFVVFPSTYKSLLHLSRIYTIFILIAIATSKSLSESMLICMQIGKHSLHLALVQWHV